MMSIVAAERRWAGAAHVAHHEAFEEQSMKRRPSACVAVLLLVLVANRTVCAQEPLAAFPESTAVVARIASIDRLSGGVKGLIGALGPRVAHVGGQFEAGIAQALQLGNSLESVDRSAPVYVAVFPLQNASPEPVAWMVKAADETKLRRAIVKSAGDAELPPAESVAGGFEKLTGPDGGSWFFGHHGDAVVYTRSPAVYELLAACHGADKKFADLVEPRAREMLHSGDAAVLVNAAKLTEIYDDELKQARDQAVRQIESLPDDMLGTGNADAQRRAYLALAKLAFDGVADANWAAGRISLGEKGASVSGLLAVKSGSASAQLVAASPPTGFENLGLLPAGALAYFGYFINPDLERAVARGYAPGAANAKELETAFDEATQSGAGASVGSFALPADAKSGMINTSLQPAEKPDLLRSSKRKYLAAMGEVKTPIFTQSSEYREEAEDYKERPVDLQTMKFELAKTDDVGLQIAQKFLERLFGGNALQTRISALEGLLVQSSGNDSKYLHRLVDVLESGEDVLGLNEAFANTRDELPEQANLLVMLNVPQLIVDFVKILREIPPIDGFIAQAPFNFGAQPAASFAGVSLGTEYQGLRLQVFVPIEQPKGVMQIFGQDF
jgi:hypothetical protein